uniref:CCHC-type domain-containing protein n=1 Tax=Leptobrachium leishanense TaxID=445787 RepID=A0A8C5R192_9ANUR
MTNYAACKRDTLRDLLESRGGIAGSKSKDALISELTEMDQRNGDTRPRSAEDLFQQRVRERIALYGADPSEASIQQAINDIKQQDAQKEKELDQKERELERKERELDRQERERERQHELQMIGRQAEARQMEPPHQEPARPKKIPFQVFKTFNESEEENEGFLQDFESLCKVHEVPRSAWAGILASKLAGRAAEAYRTVSDQDATDYSQVKQTLLARFAITPEASRTKFRISRKQANTTHVEWAHRLQGDLKGWFQGSQADTVEAVTQLILLEQFLDHTTSPIQDWVRDKKPSTVQQAATLADEYVDSRRTSGGARQPLPRPSLPPHHAATPPRWPAPRQPPQASPTSGSRCYACSLPGHLSRNCPNRSPRRPTPPPLPAAHCYQNEPQPLDIQAEWEQLYEADPVQAAAGDNRQHHRQAVWVNGQAAEGLRDSGATITLIQPHLAPQTARTGQTIAVRVAGGRVLQLAAARVHLNWGTGQRDVQVGLLQGLPAEVLLGNDLGHLTSSYTCEAALPVTTRQQSQRPTDATPAGTQVRPQASLTTQPDPPMTWDSPTDLRQQTLSDPTLEGYRDRAGKDAGGVEGDRIEWEGGLLYRYNEGRGAKTPRGPHKQLIVSQKHRLGLLRLAHDIPLAGHLGTSKTTKRLSRSFFWPRFHNNV